MGRREENHVGGKGHVALDLDEVSRADILALHINALAIRAQYSAFDVVGSAVRPIQQVRLPRQVTRPARTLSEGSPQRCP